MTLTASEWPLLNHDIVGAIGYIDLSKRRVSAEDVVKCEERYNKSKAVHSIMRHVAEKTEKDLEEINEMIAWPLYSKFGHAYEAFKLSITYALRCRYPLIRLMLTTYSNFVITACTCSDNSVFENLNIPEPILVELKANIARRLTPQPVKIRSDIEVTCFSYAGIDAIRRALKAGEAVGTETIPIKIKLVAPPLYVMLSNATDKNGAIETLEKAITVIEKTIKKEGGSVNVKLRVSRIMNMLRKPHTDWCCTCYSRRPYPRPMTWSSTR